MCDVIELKGRYGQRRKDDRARLDAMLGYAEMTGCRTAEILICFGEAPAAGCEHCDNCTVRRSAQRAAGTGKSAPGAFTRAP